MLAFIDESGDSGFSLEKGSSPFFTIACVVFKTAEEAGACDRRISELKEKLGWSKASEFHFKNNSARVRKEFLCAVEKHEFSYYCIVIKKELCKKKFKTKQEFYNYACLLVLEKAKDALENAAIIVDENGGVDFGIKLGKFLKGNINLKKQCIKNIKMQRSDSNNLLQLAD
jgi:hypothetical protein